MTRRLILSSVVRATPAFSGADTPPCTQTYFEELSAANSVLVIGGGAVGLEVAGEVATDFPEKQVTLVHSSQAVLENYPPRLGRIIIGKLKQLGVKVWRPLVILLAVCLF